MSQLDPPQRLGPDPIAAAQRDDGSPSTDDLIATYESDPRQLRSHFSERGSWTAIVRLMGVVSKPVRLCVQKAHR